MNQWHAQLGLEPVTEEKLPQLLTEHIAGDHTYQMLELVTEAPLPDTQRKRRLVVAFLRHDSRTWFFKMIGDDELVASQKPQFLEFLDSVRF